MSSKLYNKIVNLSSEELINLLESNNYHFGKILAKQSITGREFLQLQETDLIKWGLSSKEKETIWLCIKEFQKNPQAFFSKSKLDKIKIKNTNKYQNFTQQLEVLFTSKLVTSGFNNSKVTLKSTVPSVHKFNLIDQLPRSDLYDIDGYLLPREKEQNIENNFEDTLYSHNLRRKPMILPRPTTDDRGYILGPNNLEINKNKQIYENVEDKKVFFIEFHNEKKTLDEVYAYDKRKMEKQVQSQVPLYSYVYDLTFRDLRPLSITSPNPMHKSDSSHDLSSRRAAEATKSTYFCRKTNSAHKYMHLRINGLFPDFKKRFLILVRIIFISGIFFILIFLLIYVLLF